MKLKNCIDAFLMGKFLFIWKNILLEKPFGFHMTTVQPEPTTYRLLCRLYSNKGGPQISIIIDSKIDVHLICCLTSAFVALVKPWHQ